MVVIEMSNGHEIKIELDEKSAPITCANFKKLVELHDKKLINKYEIIDISLDNLMKK